MLENALTKSAENLHKFVKEWKKGNIEWLSAISYEMFRDL